MRLLHQDGRRWTVPESGWTKHADRYTRAGWRVDPNQDTDGETVVKGEGIRIRSRHNEERTVSEDEFTSTYEPAGWVKADEADAEKAKAKSAPAKKA